MFEKEDLSLLDVIDIEFLQEFQDIFASITNIATLIIDKNGPVTNPSAFGSFCADYVRSTEEGLRKCNECNQNGSQEVGKNKSLSFFCCQYGMSHFAVPILVGDRHMGTIIGGQVFTDKPTDEDYQRILSTIDATKNDEAIKALKDVKIISMEKFEDASKLLYKVANGLSEIGHKNLKLIETNKQKIVYKNIMTAIRQSLDINETKKQIVDIVGKAYGADRCYIVEYDSELDKYKLIVDEYLSSEGMLGSYGFDVNEHLPHFASAGKAGKIIVIDNYDIDLDVEERDFVKERKILEQYGVKYAVAIPLFYKGDFLGGLVVQYVFQDRKISEEDMTLLSAITEQVSIALQHAKLFEKTKKQAEREKINRKIVEVLSSSLDKCEIKSTFVQSVGEYFNADRIVFAEYDPIHKIFLPAAPCSEYLPDKTDASFVGYEWKDGSISEFVDPLINKEEIIIHNWEEYIKENQKSRGFIELFEDASVKSSYNFPVIYNNELMGFFCIEFTKEERKLNAETLEFLRGISRQMAIGLYHSNLYMKAMENSKAKGEFIANMSHEIKTPLNIIIGFSQVLAERDFDRDKQIEYLNNISSSGQHLLNLTNDIIDVSKIESGNLDLNYSVVNAQNLIMDVVNSISILASEKHINIEVDLKKIFVKADSKILTQILYNILNNAIKFTSKGGTIKVVSTTQKDNLIVSIEDTGVGISPDNYDVIFEMFKQVDSSLAKKHQGAGLGLAITKKLVELHGGGIYLASEEGKGSKFCFVLPNATEIETQVLHT